MKTLFIICSCSILVSANGFADSYSINIEPGLNLIANQLDHGSNSLNEIMPVVPDGSVLYKYDNSGSNWESVGYSAAVGSWMPDTVTLNPGEGAFFQAPTNYMLTFTGTPHVPVLPVAIPDGATYLLSCQTNDVGNWTNIVGVAPANKSKIAQWNGSGYTLFQFAAGVWNSGGAAGPTTAVGEAVWISTPGGGAPPPIPQSLLYQGLLNTALGNASLVVSGSELVVSNLGSSGQDGVSIADGAAKGQATDLTVHMDPADGSDTLPIGAFLQSQAIGTANGITNGILGTLIETKVGTGDYAINANYSALGASSYTVQVYYLGNLVAQTTNQSGATFATVNMLPIGKDLGDIITPLSDEWPYGGGALLTLSGGTTSVPCDQLIVTPDNVTTTVDQMALQITASQVPSFTINSENVSLVYQGLTNTSTGNAFIANQLDHGSNTADLVVGNLGSSGNDGVSIAMASNLTGFDVSWQALDASNTLPVGAYVQEQISGPANGLANTEWGTLTLRKAGGGQYVLSADYSAIGASTYTVQAYLKGALVGQATGQSGASLAQVQDCCSGWDWELWPRFGSTIDWGNGTPVLLGGVSLTCDRLYIMPENVPLAGTPRAMQITASQVPSFTINSENVSLVYQGLTNTSTGNAFIANQLDHGSNTADLVVGNLGSSGNDGVSIALNPGNNFAGTWLPLDPSNALPVGAYVQSQVIGNAGSITNGLLGSTRCTKMGTSNYVITVDYSPLGSSAHTVQVYNGTVLVAQVTGQTNPICAIVKLPPWICTINPWLNNEWPSPVDIAINGGPDVMGTEILMIPEGGTPVSTITAEQILAANIPSITITDESVSANYAGLTLTPVGNASLGIVNQSATQKLRCDIANIGSSGQDGVSIALPNSLTGLDLGWEPLDPSNALPVGAYVQEQIVGTGSTITNGPLGRVAITKECAVCGGSNYLVSADFSPIGASNYTVQAYLNGVLVGQATNQPGAALASCNIGGDSGCIPMRPILGGGWDWTNSDVLVTIAGGASVHCDHLYVIPENVSGTPTALQITASQVPSISLMTVAASPLQVNISHTGQNLTLQWYGTAVLQEATSLTTWTDVTNASSAYAVDPVTQGPSKFYRLIFRP